MVTILGVHDGHNASACLMEEGVVTWAIQEERMVNRKNEPGMPINAIEEILSHLKPSKKLDHVVLATRFIHQPSWYREQAFWEKTRWDYYLNKITWPFRQRLSYFRNRTRDRIRLLQRIIDRLQRPYNNPVRVIEHHTAHAAAAFYGSHYPPGQEITVLTGDGSGDGLSATVSEGLPDGRLKRTKKSTRDESIGEIYSLTTYYLGFRPWEHEYKLMGMAPYSSPDASLLDKLNSMIYVRDGEFKSTISPDFAYDHMKKIFYRKRFDVICATLQKWFEDIMMRWVESVIGTWIPHKLACGGGDFMNVKTNMLITQHDAVEDLFVFPSAGDESTSIGAAMKVCADWCLEHGMHPKEYIKPMNSLYLGPGNENLKEVEETLRKRCREQQWELREWSDIEKMTALYMAEENAIIARCSGRLEFGARALGNRSIMADAGDPDVKYPLNAQIKHRDFWMPFAPSVLASEEKRLMDNPKGIRAPYMILAFPATSAGKFELKAATHPYDHSIRPQSVEHGSNYHRILREWKRLTECGGFLNTSFNRHGWPIVKDYKVALWTFENTGLRNLVIENWLLTKK